MPDHSNDVGHEGWFVAQLKPNGLQLAKENLARQGFQCFAPLRRNGDSVRGAGTAPPLFPGYLFVKFDPAQARWQAINATRGITRLLVNDIRRPRALPSQFMAGLFARCDDTGLLKENSGFSEGDRVRVLSGPFAEVIATIEQMNVDNRLRILVEVLGRSVAVNMPSTSVEKLR